ncbi:MAG: TonB-dependent receptor [Nitrosomonas sp.]|nr:TonB-dependent receptor [Nitrosomonas sp.]
MSRLIQSNQKSQQFINLFQYGLIMLAALSAMAMPITALAQGATAATAHYSIPPGSLEQSLNRFASQAGIAISMDADKIKNLTASRLEGNYSVESGLAALLKKSGFTFEKNAAGYVLVQAKTIDGNPTKLPEIKVVDTVDANSPYNKHYNRTTNSTATRTNTPIMQTPYAIQVVPRQILQDQQAVRMETAVQNVSGVTLFPASLSGQDAFMIRGFDVQANYRNGVYMPANNNNRTEMANIEEIQVLKGPGSTMFGRTDPGGVINRVTKQPLATPFYSLQQQAGNYDFYRTAVDAGGPLTKDGSLLYRFNLSYENSGSFRDFIDRKTVFIAPVVRWNISPQTQITAEFEYQTFNTKIDGGVPPLGLHSALPGTSHSGVPIAIPLEGITPLHNRPAQLPRNFAAHEPLFNANKGDRYFVGINWSHQFNANWQIRHQLATELTSVDKYRGIVHFGSAAPDGTLNRFAFSTAPIYTNRYQSSLNLIGNINTGPLQHTLLFGYDYIFQDDKSRDVCCGDLPFNIFNPVYMNTPYPIDNTAFTPFATTQSWHGAYFQDQVKLPFNLYLTGGFRYDNTVAKNGIAHLTSAAEDRFTPRGGLLWQPMPWLAMYGSYSENFGASSTVFNVDGQRLPPQSAQQWEMGLKTEFFDKRLRATFAYFELTKQNIAVPDPSNPIRSRALGEAQTKGYEFDVSGEVLPGLSMIATYSYLPYAKILKDNLAVFDENNVFVGNSLANQGHRMFLAAEHTGTLWNVYEFRNEMLRGLKIGGGIQGVGQRQGDLDNSFQLPYYVLGNLMTSYQFKAGPLRMVAQLNVYNVSDETYYAGTNGGTFITVGAPRTFLGSLRVDY